MLKTVLILGGGMGGVVTANVLKRAAGPDARVVIVDRNDEYHFAGMYPMLLIGERNPRRITRRLGDLARKGIEFIRADVREVETENRTVVTNQGPLSYDYLVMSPGVEFYPQEIPGFSEHAFNVYAFEDVVRAASRAALFKQGHIVLFVPGPCFRFPLGPYEFIFQLDQFFRQRGIRDRVSLSLVTFDPRPFPQASPLVGESVTRMLHKREIGIRTSTRVIRVEPGELVTEDGARIAGDLFLGIAPHKAPSVIQSTGLADADGWAQVHPSTLETGCPGVYAIGDGTAIRMPASGEYAPKAGIFAHYQAEVVARNITRHIRGKGPGFAYTGKGALIMFSGSGKARYSSVRYFQNPPLFTLLEPTTAAYWAKLAFERYWLSRWF
ncbi:MAG: FAD-dependent oxidoreductase [Bacillota bacterium]